MVEVNRVKDEAKERERERKRMYKTKKERKKGEEWEGLITLV